MKLYILTIALALTMAFNLNAQTAYNLSFETVAIGTGGDAVTDKLNVVIKLSFDQAGDVGGGNIRFDYDAVKLSNPILFQDILSANGNYFSVGVNEPAAGVASLNITHFPGSPAMPITTTDQAIAVIQFDVEGPYQTGNQTTDFTYRTNGTNPSTTLRLATGTSLDPGTIQDALGALLPIELAEFEVSKRGENASLLEWMTVSEVNASHFEIERSYDAQNFDYLGYVNAQGESKEAVSYQFIDSDFQLSQTASNIIYYRLKMVDNDGSFEYSEVKLLRFDNDDFEVGVHPNPTADFITIDSDSEIKGITILDIDGKIISDNIPYTGKVDLTSLSAGMYKILISTENGNFLKSVVKVD